MSIRIYFNPLDIACKSIIGAVKQRKKIQFNVYCIKTDAIFDGSCTPNLEDCFTPSENATLHFNRDGENAEFFTMEKTAFGWSIALQICKPGLYYYTFAIENVGFISCGALQQGKITQSPQGFLLTVYSTTYKTPEWFKGGVMYQIFPDRFCKQGTMPDIKGRIRREDWGGLPSYKPNENGKVLNNDFFGGNLQGIESKLDYLKELGVTVLYLNPIFEAASNHRYDTSNYLKIDRMLGTEEDFKNLVNAAKLKGIRIILDGVFNHTGDDSVYFNKYGNYPSVGAYQSKNSPYYSWYSFTQFPEKYESWWGIDVLPQVNEHSMSYQNFIFGKNGVLKTWLSYGIGGYRLDVADELPDFFLKKLRKSVKEEDNDAIIIGEVWEDASDKIAYSQRREYLQGKELDSVMNYPLKDAIIRYVTTGNVTSLVQTVYTLIDHYPKQTLDCLMNILGTHDTARILTVLGGIYCQNKEEMAKKGAYLSETTKQTAIEKLKMAAVLQYTLPGVPCVYYGDENAMEGHIDPFCRQCFDWEHLNEDLISFYKRLGRIRADYQNIFKDGEFSICNAKDELLYYKREKDNECVYIVINNGAKSYQLQTYTNHKNILTDAIYKNQIEIQPYSYQIFVKCKN